MALTDFSDRLDNLRNDVNARTQSARLRQYVPAIEKALADGIPLETIRAEKFTLSLAGLKSALYRIRRRNKGNAQAPVNTDNHNQSSTPPPVRTTTRAPAPTASTSIDNPHTPSPESSDDLPRSGVHSTLPGFRSIQDLRKQHPTMPRAKLNKLWAQQYAGPTISSEQIDELKRKYGSGRSPCILHGSKWPAKMVRDSGFWIRADSVPSRLIHRSAGVCLRSRTVSGPGSLFSFTSSEKAARVFARTAACGKW
ncbi:hypothetical protein [Paraburkholderia aspalathi]|uniref:hypothetical protein n=1 Tax=Paraburkholderia aspalathi TaxID=1324617 RepID=UPI0038BA0CF5